MAKFTGHNAKFSWVRVDELHDHINKQAAVFAEAERPADRRTMVVTDAKGRTEEVKIEVIARR